MEQYDKKQIQKKLPKVLSFQQLLHIYSKGTACVNRYIVPYFNYIFIKNLILLCQYKKYLVRKKEIKIVYLIFIFIWKVVFGGLMNNSEINWEQVRIDASINIMNAILSSSIMVFIFQFIFKRQIADIAVSYADKLIEELKK